MFKVLQTNCPSLIDAPPAPHAATNFQDAEANIEHYSEPAESSPDAQNAPSDNREPRFQPQPAVRFKSVVEEINPAAPSQSYTTSGKDEAPGEDGETGEVTADQIRALSKSLRGCHLQERRMNIFSYQPFSLPASRVRCSCWFLLLETPFDGLSFVPQK